MGRAKQTLWDAMAIAIGYGLIVSVGIQFTAPEVVGIFTDDEGVIKSGSEYLRSYIWDTGLAGIHFCFSGFFCACGMSIVSFIHNIIAIVTMRVPFSYLLSVNYPDTLYPMGIATPMGSAISVIVCIGFYVCMSRKGKLK